MSPSDTTRRGKDHSCGEQKEVRRRAINAWFACPACARAPPALAGGSAPRRRSRSLPPPACAPFICQASRRHAVSQRSGCGAGAELEYRRQRALPTWNLTSAQGPGGLGVRPACTDATSGSWRGWSQPAWPVVAGACRHCPLGLRKCSALTLHPPRPGRRRSPGGPGPSPIPEIRAELRKESF